MYITHESASAYNLEKECAAKYLYTYNFGIREPSNLAAAKGTVVHKNLEILALKKLAIQNQQELILDDDLGELGLNKCIAPLINELSFDFFKNKESHLVWSDEDKEDCLKWTNKVLDYKGGMFNPEQREIVSSEKYFEIYLEGDDFKYDFIHPNGEHKQGQLCLNGVIDLVVSFSGNKYYEIIDWKTGSSRKDWITGKVKEIEDFQKDIQLRIYALAASYLYPEIENVMVTIFYVNAGGPYTLSFSKNDIEDLKNSIKESFQRISKTEKPTLISNDQKWKCSKLCYFGKNHHEKYYEQTLCEFYQGEIKKKGLAKTAKEARQIIPGDHQFFVF
ncbi:MAG: PD-(D/E)XK nuclease family protein, partial [Nanoarchaeota archaeon]